MGVKIQGTAISKIEKLKAGLTKEKTDPIVAQVAFRTHAALVMKTPKGFTGQTRRDWNVFKRTKGGGYLVTNQSKVMFFLEKGTKAHGPANKKYLYIPLHRSAALSGWHSGLTRGEDYYLTKKVGGIKAMKIVATQRVLTRSMMQTQMRRYIKQLIAS